MSAYILNLNGILQCSSCKTFLETYSTSHKFCWNCGSKFCPPEEVNTPSPGPWHVVRGKIARDILHLAIMADNGDMPCSVTPMDALRPIDEANAHLIAAAPDLLAALKELMTCFYPTANPHNPRVLAAEAAIAKAEGRNV